ncbi:hypothetical protein [Achromobacter piechaudii]|uniref:Uncharacterized protein n=1 Tax=Achromobacter piechaudii ATCC 43553 TaxID=742159 RepID=D4XAP6_9BURK|nr:hypothetical protein [Achromobacter piechaudii]EFF76118.1 hypothetical protein HMPREF0004_2543 [Achromobacter piechaudii ATCC 43553]
MTENNAAQPGQDPLFEAIDILTVAADELRHAHTLGDSFDDWTGEPEAKAEYDRTLRVVAALSKLRAEGVQADGKRHDLDWIEGVRVTDTVGRGWCVRIDGTDIFEDVNRYGCKGRRSFQIASGLPNKQDAERVAAEWLDHQRAALASAPVAAISIGVNASGQGATICIMQPHADGSATTIYSEMHPLGDSMGRAALASAPVAGEAQPVELRGVAETIKDGDGFWRSCSGCHELNEGRDTGPYSAVFKCHLGNGCSECGGIGAIWDSTDYQAMADAMARDMGQSVNAAPQASEAVRILFPAHLRKMWSGGAVQAWLDEHQGITPPKASAKGSMERYRNWQAEQAQADKDGGDCAKGAGDVS